MRICKLCAKKDGCPGSVTNDSDMFSAAEYCVDFQDKRKDEELLFHSNCTLEIIKEEKATSYEQGLRDAWALARKIAKNTQIAKNMFNVKKLKKVFTEYTIDEAKKIINTFTYTLDGPIDPLPDKKKESDRIKIGDIVNLRNRVPSIGIVISPIKSGMVDILIPKADGMDLVIIKTLGIGGVCHHVDSLEEMYHWLKSNNIFRPITRANL